MDSLSNLPKLLQELQAIQSDMTFFSEFGSLPEGSEQSTLLSTLEQAVSFIVDEIMGSESALEEALAANDWIDAESSNIYFEFEVVDDYKCHVSAGTDAGTRAPHAARSAHRAAMWLGRRALPRGHRTPQAALRPPPRGYCRPLPCASTQRHARQLADIAPCSTRRPPPALTHYATCRTLLARPRPGPDRRRTLSSASAT